MKNKSILCYFCLVVITLSECNEGNVDTNEEHIRKGCFWQNEKFDSCFGGCAEISCDNPAHIRRPCYPYCEPGCICKSPFVRDDRTHQCVLVSECSIGPMGIPQDKREIKEKSWRFVSYSGLSDRAKYLKDIHNDDYYFDESDGTYLNYAPKRKRLTFEGNGNAFSKNIDKNEEVDINKLKQFKNKDHNGFFGKKLKAKLKSVYRIMKNSMQQKYHNDIDDDDDTSTEVIAVNKLQLNAIIKELQERDGSNEVIDLDKSIWKTLHKNVGITNKSDNAFTHYDGSMPAHNFAVSASDIEYQQFDQNVKNPKNKLWNMKNGNRIHENHNKKVLKRQKRNIKINHRHCKSESCHCDCQRCLSTTSCCYHCCEKRVRIDYASKTSPIITFPIITNKQQTTTTPTTTATNFPTIKTKSYTLCVPTTCLPYNFLDSICPAIATTPTPFTRSTMAVFISTPSSQVFSYQTPDSQDNIASHIISEYPEYISPHTTPAVKDKLYILSVKKVKKKNKAMIEKDNSFDQDLTIRETIRIRKAKKRKRKKKSLILLMLNDLEN